MRGVVPVLIIPIIPAFGPVSVVAAAVIGTNPPAQPLTVERVAALPAKLQPAWKEYWERSERQRRADQDFLQKEMGEHGIKQALVPPSGRSTTSVPLNKPAPWYAEADARRIADIVVSFQTPAGGWSKNLDLSRQPRVPGEGFAPDNNSRYLGRVDYDTPADSNWNYVGTFDNNATTSQLRYLARVIAAVGPRDSGRYRAAFLRGLDYILAAQYPNGGWPQVWPLQGGYHDAITYNDNAMVNVLNLLRDVSVATNEFAFVPGPTRELATTSLQRGIDCILATQIVVGGRRTVWCQQHDSLTLEPTSARNYEMPSQAGSESAGILMFLMQLPKPSPPVVGAVHAAAAWFVKTKISGRTYQRDGNGSRRLATVPGAGPLWARCYEIGTARPIFGDRDRTIHDNLDEISPERRRGYAWYGDAANRALERYASWSKAHP
ncbi:MAG TPA: pectate lyase [Verrucomicrobiae bacterium]|nr:pectate lyase [Verrucomicrobiae bacterium]